MYAKHTQNFQKKGPIFPSRRAIVRDIAYCNEIGIKAPGGYCRVRAKIPYKVYADLARHLARELDKKVPKHWKPFGRTTWITDKKEGWNTMKPADLKYLAERWTPE